MLSTEAQINRYFRTKGNHKGLPRHKARRGNPTREPLVASIKIPQNLGFSTYQYSVIFILSLNVREEVLLNPPYPTKEG